MSRKTYWELSSEPGWDDLDFLQKLEKVVDECIDTEALNKEVRRDQVEYEMHADGVKEICKFCPEDDPCKRTWCPYTEGANESKN